MANHQLLDNVTHKDLKVITDRSAWYGDDVASAGVFPLEFRRVQAEYPIAFRKNESTGLFEALALFGFTAGENLFLDADGWNASYIPLSIERQPFLIGFQSTTDGGVPVDEPVVHIDMDSPRISHTEGHAVFLEHGGYSPFLEHISSVLMAIHDGYEYMKEFSAALTEFNLLEPFSLDLSLSDGSKQRLAGLHTISEVTLNALGGESLARLHGHGYLEHIYMVMASIANFSTLIDKKNARF
jgi:hypothetical protein